MLYPWFYFQHKILKKKFTDNFFFEYNKCYYLPNAIINIRDYINQIHNKEKINFDKIYKALVKYLYSPDNIYVYRIYNLIQ